MTQPGMDVSTGAILGAVQGLTEFLPISSDGHLAIGAMLFGQADMPLPFVVFLHIGTLLATLLVQNGTLRVGDIVLAGTMWGRVRGMYTEHGEELESQFGDQEQFIGDILAKREELLETFEAHKQALLD